MQINNNCVKGFVQNSNSIALNEQSSMLITAGLKKLGVQWLIEHFASHQQLWWVDNFVLRNPQLLKPANRRYRLANQKAHK